MGSAHHESFANVIVFCIVSLHHFLLVLTFVLDQLLVERHGLRCSGIAKNFVASGNSWSDVIVRSQVFLQLSSCGQHHRKIMETVCGRLITRRINSQTIEKNPLKK